MSRMTAAQVIAVGEYLEPDFDPASLTVPQLLGVFGFHNINYPTPYTKGKLVQLFNDEIKTRADKFKKERSKRESSQASDDGITDGHTGRPLNEGRKPVRRSSRRLSRAPTSEEEPQTEVAPPKRRRSSAQPSLGGPSRQKAVQPAEPTLVEESEPEEEIVVRKVGRSKKSTADAGSSSRRVSQGHAEDSGWEDNNIFQSGAESSSPARASPVRPRTRQSRTSMIPRPNLRSRQSMSAPPLFGPPSPQKEQPAQPSPSPKGKGKLKEPIVHTKPPESEFEPQLPPQVAQESKATASRATRRSALPQELADSRFKVDAQVEQVETQGHTQEQDEEEERQLAALKASIARIPPDNPVTDAPAEAGQAREETDEILEELADEVAAEDSTDLIDEDVRAVSQRIAEGGRIVPNADERESTSLPLALRVFLLLLALATSGFLVNYKQESAQLGFCDTGRITNAILDDVRVRRAAVENCNRENRTTLFPLPEADGTSTAATAEGVESESQVVVTPEACPLPPPLPVPHPDSCTPCPPHAKCTVNTVTCDNGFILRPHPLLLPLSVPTTSPNTFARPQYTESLSISADIPRVIYSVFSFALDGLPGFGPVALPPRCVEDPRRKRHIGALGKAIETTLASERGRRLCEGVGVGEPDGDEVIEAKRWGLEVEVLKDEFKKKTAGDMQETLEYTFNEAVQQLVQWGGVFIAEDVDGTRYLAHKTPQMGWDCALRVKARDAWLEWQKTIAGTAAVVLSIFAFRRRQAQARIENERVASLVQIALDLLRNQEMAHHTDPVTAPQPYLSSLQLRDLILQDEHSVRARQQLWERVERVVEGNANVRTNLEEVAGGDELRVWRWVGSAGKAISPGSPGGRRIQFDDKGESSGPVA
ncbi:hypothetical protein CERSUDRAFT_94053 [Gelatoporia subvermispora B]|uniref:Man1/Src1 C-terminal domain-containing protein n=1 Tax=Ceriporiopsis subvermispora (strain B) TaxID=914234 RepID=M2R1Y6_CERS8|nr:hypothetical protein CERSUDRAFT_94053 [Gelatoporia subvermispora B]